MYLFANSAQKFPFSHTFFFSGAAIIVAFKINHFNSFDLVFLICISLLISDDEHFFHVPMIIRLISLERLFRHAAHKFLLLLSCVN